MELNLKNKVLEALKNDYNQKIINSNDFYFLKAQEALHHFLEIKLNNETEEYLITHKKNYDELKQLFEDSEELNEFGKAIFTLISYCDLKAYKKNDFNLYDDKRVLALAFVRMNNWVEQLLTYKFENQLSEGSVKNAIDYLLNPIDNFTMLSENHRSQISENLFKKEYHKNTFKEDFINFFSELSINVKNPLNYTHLLTRISYDISSEWKESLIGIMASDSTGWLENYVMQEDYDVFWNSKRPSGTDKTIKLLKECIAENGHFKLFYTSYYNVNYIAEVIDVVESEREYIKADWNTNYSRSSIYPNFQELADNNKNAKIVFLINKFYKVEPISHNQFKIYKSFKFPTQDNLTPIESYITNSENIKKQIMSREIDILEYKKQIILQGPPGTGKTREAKLIAKEILGLNSTDDLKDNEQFKLIQFHPSYTYEDFVRGIVAESKDDKIEYKNVNKTLGEFAEVALKNYTTSKETGIDNNLDSWIDTQFELFKEDIKAQLPENEIPLSGDITIYDVADNSFKYGKNWKTASHILFGEFKSLVRAVIKNELELSNKQMDKEKFRHAHYRYTYYNALLEKFFQEYKYESSGELIKEKKYILVIDEINRANLSSVLGELIYALEYRNESVHSPYGIKDENNKVKTELILPPNLYIIGTMNTADRSVGHIDYAIRRRFAFVEVLPKDLTTEMKEGEFYTDLFSAVKGLFTRDEYQTKSDFISQEFEPKDVALGHSYFIDKTEEGGDKKTRWHYEIKPILLEYVRDGVLKENTLEQVITIETTFDLKI
ncbi:AAA family ATPase [Amniculibacterium sp. G2-70]|uniref:AAA family ATPase n=1 Tax=Amniculibacterium sp. G2-70 TaxID=2767188 RepID=UPI0016548FE4|nr:AAA family ATPase [Amniculibacterium sp. G2-70]